MLLKLSRQTTLFFIAFFLITHTSHLSANPSDKGNNIDNTMEELLRGASVQQGFIDVASKNGEYYFIIPSSIIHRDLLVVNTLEKVPVELNEAGVNSGTNYQNMMIRWEWDKTTNTLFLRQQRPLPHTPHKDRIALSVANNYISPIIGAFTIEATSKDSSRLAIKVNDIYNGSNNSINNVFSNINLGSSPISNLSRILQIRAHKGYISASCEQTTRVTEGNESVYVTVQSCSYLILLPQQPMMGRYANSKVGYFTTPLIHFSDAQHEVYTQQYITRWNLIPNNTKKYLQGELVEPIKPIVFYIDEATPTQWIPYIKQGVEDWQKAFEKAGFKNAIIAQEISQSAQPSWPLSGITYAASFKKNAMGPSIVDPRSGEILGANIMWWHNVLDILGEWITVQTAATNPLARQYPLSEELMGDAIRFVVAHEVGHSLGLRHNMIASWSVSIDSLRSSSFTSKHPCSASIMDYTRFNYVAQPSDHVSLSAPTIGEYDLFAIEYGYRWYDVSSPVIEEKLLQSFIQKHNDPKYKFSEAQDPRNVIDPRAQSEDLGDNPVQAAMLGIDNLKRIVPNILHWTSEGQQGKPYNRASKLYYAAIYQWNTYLYHAMANIGGIYIENTTVGDSLKVLTFVEKHKQADALNFIIQEAFYYPKWLFDTDIEQVTLLLKNTPNGVQENTPSMVLSNIQTYIMWDLLSNSRLMRMLDNERKNGKQAFTVQQLMDELFDRIFKQCGRQPDMYQRTIQKMLVDALITAASSSQAIKINKNAYEAHPLMSTSTSSCVEHASLTRSAPREIQFYSTQSIRLSDVISIKRGLLLKIEQWASHASKSKSPYSEHFKDISLRIHTALNTL